MSYYDHDIKVKAMDNILSRSQEWEWFIEYTEEKFDVDLNVHSFDDALRSFKSINIVFDFLCRIHEITDHELVISKLWLKEIDHLAQFCNGKYGLDELTLESTFAKIMLLPIYAGRIYSQIKNEKFYYYVDIFKYRNLHSIDDLEMFAEEENHFEALFLNIGIDIEKEKQCFKDNINRVTFPARDSFLSKHESDLLSATAFSFNDVKDDDVCTWQEQELLNMLAVSFSEGKIIPMWKSGEYSYPNISFWTKEVIKDMTTYFDNEVANFILESIRYALYGTEPSKTTINKHFELLHSLYQKELDESDYYCSSLAFILSFFDSKYSRLIDEISYKTFNQDLQVLDAHNCEGVLFKIRDHKAIFNNEIKDKLNGIIIAQVHSIDSINESHFFLNYINNKRIRELMDQESLLKVSQTFDVVLRKSKNLICASMFIDYLSFLMEIKHNKNVISDSVSTEIIRIRTLWKDEYYEKCYGSLHIQNLGSLSIPQTTVDSHIYIILSSPIAYTQSITQLKSEMLLDNMIQISNHALLTMVKRIAISEDFPYENKLTLDDKHPIDLLYLNEIKEIIKDKSYKFLNVMKPHEYATGIYQRIEQELHIRMSLLNDVEPLYSAVIQQNPDYKFIEYSSTPLLGHLTQLFPILENKIRIFGELFNIVPICERTNLSHRLKEPYSILNTVLMEAIQLTGSMENASDLFFIHFCMYGENGLNIRNDCIHGNGYNTDSEILFAFKITLICLYVIGYRYQLIIDNFIENPIEETNDEE